MGRGTFSLSTPYGTLGTNGIFPRVSREVGTFNSIRYIRNQEGVEKSLGTCQSFNSIRYIRNNHPPLRMQPSYSLSTPYGTLGTFLLLNGIFLRMRRLSTPYGTLGTHDVLVEGCDFKVLSTPYGTLGTEEFPLECSAHTGYSFNSTRYIRNY